jgi:murein DD-endopeptidase MepM/ murein hydrolase activator NlpD
VDYQTFLNRDYRSGPEKTIRPLIKRAFIIAIVALLVITGVLLFLFSGTSPRTPEQETPQAAEHDTQNPESSTRVRKTLPLPGDQSATEHELVPLVSEAEPDEVETNNWAVHKIHSGDSLSSIFSALEIHSQLNPVLADKVASKALKSIYPGQVIKVLKENGQLQELVYEPNDKEILQVTRSESGYQARLVNRPVETRRNRASGVIHDSLFLAGRKAGLTDNVIMELAGIFGWDVDFALDIREGDSFTVIYEELFREGEKIGTGAIVAAEFTNQGHSFRAIRYQTPDGDTGYYSPDGHSMRKAFLRTPVNFTRISSRFSTGRKHPILNTIRAHKGVDYAAPKGTPVKAAGDGKVIFKGRKGGYGRVVILQHGSVYSTLYGHLNAFNRKLRVGSRVKQGQIIGYVGMSGLATGPHLHYEFRVNGVHRNPLTVKLPDAEPLPKKYMADFNNQSQPLLTQLDLYRRTTLADAGGMSDDN